MLLLVLAGNFVLLIVGWAFVGFASYADQLLVPAQHGDEGGHEGVRDQRGGRRRANAGGVLHLRELGTFDFLAAFEAAPDTITENEGVLVLICLLLLVGAFAKSPSCRSTPGSPTRWRARRRSRR